MRNSHMHYLVPPAYLKYTLTSGGLWADAWRACQLGIRLQKKKKKNPGNRDFLQIEDRLVFSCLRIISWWRDVTLRWISDFISVGFYSCHPCPWTRRPCPKLAALKSLPFFFLFYPDVFVRRTPAPQHPCYSALLSSSIPEIRDNEADVWQTWEVWSC